MNIAEIDRIEAEAAADEIGQVDAGGPVALLPDLAEELAEFLDMAAKIGAVATRLPVAVRFTHEANLDISRQLIKVCERQGWDARAVLIGQDSALGVWLGLGVSIAIPGFAVWGDWKAAKALEARQAEAEKQGARSGEAGDGQQPGE